VEVASNSLELDFAMNSAGETAAVSEGLNAGGGNFSAEVSLKARTGRWLEPTVVSPDGHDAYDPKIAIGPTGDAVVAWTRDGGTSRSVIQVARLHPGEQWTKPVTVSRRGASYPAVAVDGAGNATVVWNSSERRSSVIRAASSPANGSWTDPVELGATTPVAVPRVVAGRAGEAVALWDSPRGLALARRPPGEAWQTATWLSGPMGGNGAIAIGPAGTVVALWTRYTPTREPRERGIVQAALISAKGHWSAPQNLTTLADETGNPAVAVDGAGDVVATWQRSDGRDTIIQLATKRRGAPWSAPVRMSARGQSANWPDVAVDDHGDAVVVWTRYDGAHEIVQGRVGSDVFALP
jgi:hypothetical protein